MSNLICSFCGKREGDIDDVFTIGRTGCICGSCVEQVAMVSQREEEKRQAEAGTETTAEAEIDWKSKLPKKLKKHIEQFVAGQAEAAKVVSVCIYNHYKRIFLRKKAADNEAINAEEVEQIEKSNLLLIGPTGTGKTLMMKIIGEHLGLPLVIYDASTLTEAGYVGNDADNIIFKLLQASNYNVKKAEKGIVFIDEIDKIGCAQNSGISKTRDVGGKGVQDSLLRLIEGDTVSVPAEGGRKHPDQKTVSINTRDILFIGGGAFEGLASIIRDRLTDSSIGFQTNTSNTLSKDDNILKHITTEDLKNYGMIPELIGRLPSIATFNPLTRGILRDILHNVKGSPLQQYKKKFAMDNIKLTFTEDAINAIIDKVLPMKIGARGLRNVLEKTLMHAMFSLPDEQRQPRQLAIDKTYIDNIFKNTLPEKNTTTDKAEASKEKTIGFNLLAAQSK
ncbi:MAG: ATP-dependent Clp protease ATP-binding subunit ClpX [Cytophagales bacterium]